MGGQEVANGAKNSAGAAGARKAPVTGAVFGKNARTKSSFGGGGTQ